MDYNPLKQRHHGERKNYPHNLSLRVHRALSGLHLACPDENDLDGQFILLWPAFNTAYNQYVVCLNVIEAVAFSRFVTKISDVDHNQDLTKLVWIFYPSSIRLLLDNPYVFQSFWDHQKGHDNVHDNVHNRQEKTHKDKPQANMALAKQHTNKIIELVLTRLYTLRNHIIHAGATWNCNVNRSQLFDGVNLLSKQALIIINVMMNNPHVLWGEANYPMIE